MAEVEAAWIRIQRKTFSRWMNNFLLERSISVNILEQDIQDGVVLHNLLECLSQEKIMPQPNKKAKLKLQKIENLNTCLRYVKSKDIKLVGIGAEDIHDGRTNLILGLIWTLILRFQIAGAEDPEVGKARQLLLEWCNSVLNPQGLSVQNFKDSWQDGRSFLGLVNALEPGSINLENHPGTEASNNMNHAFEKAEQLFAFPKVLDAVDVIENPDELSIMTYVSYFRAYLMANTAYGPKCYAEGLGLTQATALKPATFLVYAVNEEGERSKRGGARVKAFLQDKNGQMVTEVLVKDKLDGTYLATYTSPKAGEFTLTVTVGKDNIKDSPFKPTVEPGEPFPGNSIATGPGIKSAAAGAPATFVVHTKDQEGNDFPTGGAKIIAHLHDKSGSIPVNVVDNKDGTYTCSYSPKTAGKTTLDVSIATEAFGTAPIKDAPFSVTILPGLADPLNFGWEGLQLDANGRRVVVAGTPDVFTVTAKDGFGNQLQSGGLNVQGHVKGPHSVPVLVNDQADGTYQLSYTPTHVGDYNLSVSVDNTKIGGKHNPFPFVVIPAGPSAANSIAHGKGTEVAVVGADNNFTVETRDAFDNKLTTGGADVGGQLTHLESGETVPLVVADNGDGTYAASYPDLRKAGNYELTPTVSGVPIKSAPIHLKVKPGGTNLDNTSVDFPEVNVSGELGPIVSLRDDNQNLRSDGDDHVVAELLPKSRLPPVKAKPKGDGTYEVFYPPNARGKYDVTVKVNGKEAPGGPYEVDVSDNPLTEEQAQAVDQILPKNVAGTFKRLLSDADNEERKHLLEALAALKKQK